MGEEQKTKKPARTEQGSNIDGGGYVFEPPLLLYFNPCACSAKAPVARNVWAASRTQEAHDVEFSLDGGGRAILYHAALSFRSAQTG